MARKSAVITISKEGRDQGKAFHIRELPAMQAERLAMRAFFALARSGADIPEDIASSGLAGIAELGLKAFSGLHFEDAEPILDELFTCVSFIPDPSKPDFMRKDFEGDIEEIPTIFQLRLAIFSLHLNFSTAAGTSTSTAAASTLGRGHMQNTQMSQSR